MPLICVYLLVESMPTNPPNYPQRHQVSRRETMGSDSGSLLLFLDGSPGLGKTELAGLLAEIFHREPKSQLKRDNKFVQVVLGVPRPHAQRPTTFQSLGASTVFNSLISRNATSLIVARWFNKRPLMSSLGPRRGSQEAAASSWKRSKSALAL